jgi:hypothetical protein
MGTPSQLTRIVNEVRTTLLTYNLTCDTPGELQSLPWSLSNIQVDLLGTQLDGSFPQPYRTYH